MITLQVSQILRDLEKGRLLGGSPGFSDLAPVVVRALLLDHAQVATYHQLVNLLGRQADRTPQRLLAINRVARGLQLGLIVTARIGHGSIRVCQLLKIMPLKWPTVAAVSVGKLGVVHGVVNALVLLAVV